MPTDGLKAVLVERLKTHLESKTKKDADLSPKQQMMQSDASPGRDSRSPKNDSSPKTQSNVVADVSPKNSGSPKHQTDEAAASAAELAKKRAERFGIPVYTEEAVPKEVKKAEPIVAAVADKVDEDMEKEKGPNPMEEFRELIRSAMPADCVVLTIEDLMGDGRNAKPMRMYIEANGEDKLKELIGEMIGKIATEFDNDRAKIQVPVKLAAFRLSKTLRFGKFEKRTREGKGDRENKRDDKRDDRGDKKKKWTDDEWADWKKGPKKDDWNNKRKSYDDGYKDDYKKSRSRDPFESDVEEFIRSNRLDKRSADVMKTESKGMAEFVMDAGFNLNKYDNPSKEVMLRMKEYIQKKRDSRNYYAPKQHSRSRTPPGRAPAPAAYRSRSASRDRYDRRSRSVSV